MFAPLTAASARKTATVAVSPCRLWTCEFRPQPAPRAKKTLPTKKFCRGNPNAGLTPVYERFREAVLGPTLMSCPYPHLSDVGGNLGPAYEQVELLPATPNCNPTRLAIRLSTKEAAKFCEFAVELPDGHGRRRHVLQPLARQRASVSNASGRSVAPVGRDSFEPPISVAVALRPRRSAIR